MKRLIIAGLMLAAAIACSKQNPESTYLVDPGKADPVADFEYEIDREAGIVHFKNTSTGAIAYRWEFGDAAGSSSIEENPSFTYTESGTYTVSLKASNGYVSSLKTVTIDYELPADVIIMSIDGNIDDWEKIPYRDDVDVWGAVTAIKTATTGSNLYVLIEGTSVLATGVNDDVAVDLDNNPETGKGGPKANEEFFKGQAGADMFIEGGGLFVYRNDGTKDCDWIEGGWPEYSDFVTVGDKVYKEYRFNMETGWLYVENPSETFRISFYFRDGSWTGIGGTIDNDEWTPFSVTMGEWRDFDEL